MRIGWNTGNPPDVEEWYLVQYESGSMDVCCWTGIFYFGGDPIKTDWHWTGKAQYAKIIAWHLLPKPYLEEEDDKK